jgi:hypothetical protein
MGSTSSSPLRAQVNSGLKSIQGSGEARDTFSPHLAQKGLKVLLHGLDEAVLKHADEIRTTFKKDSISKETAPKCKAAAANCSSITNSKCHEKKPSPPGSFVAS